MREGSDGSWHVELNSDTLPRVLVNTRYYTEVKRSARSPNDKSYLTDCLATANWLVKSLDQRARTIVKVASEIVLHPIENPSDARVWRTTDGVDYDTPGLALLCTKLLDKQVASSE